MKRIFMTAVIALFSLPVLAGPGSSSIDILKLASGIKSQAMGGAYTALCDDPEAMDINPAGLSLISGSAVMLVHDIYLMDVFYDSLYYVHGFENAGALGINVKYLNAGSVTEAYENELGDFTGYGGEISGYNFLVGAGYSMGLDKFFYSELTRNINIGVALNITGESLGDDYSNFGISVDAGAIYTIVIEESDFMLNRGKTIFNKAGIGLVVRNAGTSFEGAATPLAAGVGGYIQILNIASEGNRIRASTDIEYGSETGVLMKIGAEYRQELGNIHFALRTGANLGGEAAQRGALSAGAGIGIKAGRSIYEINYVFLPFGDLGSSNKIGLYAKF
ncbi:MAG: UPF0164 family protein [Candidatus Goldiibacteriota bacterium]